MLTRLYETYVSGSTTFFLLKFVLNPISTRYTNINNYSMQLTRFLITLGLISTSIILHSQVLTDEEKILYDLIMQYRKNNRLPEIPLSTSLTYVAQTHVKDLAINRPDIGNCNAHSWSSNGTWSSCCYTPDHAQAECMWKKPQELTKYKGNGFEIACGSNGCCSNFVMSANYALQSWKSSPGHNAVIINQGNWAKQQWNAIGIGLFKGFAVVWFGHEFDNN